MPSDRESPPYIQRLPCGPATKEWPILWRNLWAWFYRATMCILMCLYELGCKIHELQVETDELKKIKMNSHTSALSFSRRPSSLMNSALRERARLPLLVLHDRTFLHTCLLGVRETTFSFSQLVQYVRRLHPERIDPPETLTRHGDNLTSTLSSTSRVYRSSRGAYAAVRRSSGQGLCFCYTRADTHIMYKH